MESVSEVTRFRRGDQVRVTDPDHHKHGRVLTVAECLPSVRAVLTQDDSIEMHVIHEDGLRLTKEGNDD